MWTLSKTVLSDAMPQNDKWTQTQHYNQLTSTCAPAVFQVRKWVNKCSYNQQDKTKILLLLINCAELNT